MKQKVNQFTRMKAKETAAIAEKVKNDLLYDCETGVVSWAKSCGHGRSGKPAGCACKDVLGKSYILIEISRKRFMAHRISWLLKTGDWPENQIDHQDGDGLNNKWSNLRAATNRQNSMNTKQRKSASGHRGVRWHSIGKKWNARIVIDGKEKSLGMFHDINDAIAARLSAEKEVGYHENHGRKQ